ncbi:uncharacterized protein B0H64DRAFT_175674 [Chaetomium fimeti]|uniref:Uncharacterized protein n=1 Tax=Chaetomium fimeti TaxID=1854472 RepID=A0AAE0LQP2_9PEZI|nr:hypothetical protein B0H64DRAFT_175674 [Chaetomium fimeti]
MFQGLFRAAHKNLLEHKFDVFRSICAADFVTDSATMVQLFTVASEVYRQTPRVTTELHLDLFVHVINGKVFMKASHPPYGHFRRDATGQLVPPRFGFCERIRSMNAQCFKRATTYKIQTSGGSVITPFNILIQDDHLSEVLRPGVQPGCVSHRSCQYHGATNQHAISIVPQGYRGSLIDFWNKEGWTEILPRVYFAGCEEVLLGRFGVDLKKGFWDSAGPSHVPPMFSQSWGQCHPGELWSLAILLEWIHIRAEDRTSTYGRDTQFTVRLKPTSSKQYGGAIVPVYDIVAEKSETGERLVSEKDVETLCRWMTEPGSPYPPAGFQN